MILWVGSVADLFRKDGALGTRRTDTQRTMELTLPEG
jgi:hypothetical protein